MRPRYLEIEGLQSFKELQAIDFDKLGETGLFGIFGPTGSGKSTILDAITLALYGTVQRANRGTHGIINTSSSTLRVSFTFDLAKNNTRKTYRVERVYRRKKDSENYIESRVARLIEISPLGETVIADKQGEVNEAVIGLIGLQFDDFTRSVVLPQNKFQEFLLAPKAEKTKMLERIFYLEEYGRELTEKVNRMLGKIRNKLSGIEGALSLLGDISEDSLKEAEAVLNSALQQKNNADKALNSAEKEYVSAREVWELTAELQETVHRQQELYGMAEEMEEIGKRCRKALAAQSLIDSINDLRKTKGELEKTEEELQRLHSVLSGLEDRLKKSLEDYEAARTLRETRIPVLVEYRTKLEDAIKTRKELEDMEKVLNKLREEYILLNNKVVNWEKTISSHKAELGEALKKEAELKKCAELLKVEADYREKVQQGAALEDELERAQRAKEQHKARYNELSGIIGKQEQELSAMEKAGLDLENRMKEAEALYQEHRKKEHWDRNDILKAETRYYGVKSITDALKLKSREIEQLQSKISDCAGQMEILQQKLSSLNTEKAKKLRELEDAKLLLEEKRTERERSSAFLLAQKLRENEPCPVCGSTSHPSPAVQSGHEDEAAVEEEIRRLQSVAEGLDLEYRTLENDEIRISMELKNLVSHKETLEADERSRREEQAELLDKLPEDYRGLSASEMEDALDRLMREKQVRLMEVENWEKRLAELEELLKRAEAEYNRYQVEISGKRSQLEVKRGQLEELHKECVEAEEAYNDIKAACENAVKALGIDSMKEELRRIREKDSEAEKINKELQTLENTVEELRKKIEEAEEAKKLDKELLSENVAEGKGLRYQKEEKEKQILALFGDKDLNAEKEKTEKEIEFLTKREQNALENVNIVREQYETAIKDKKVCEKQREFYQEKLRKDTGRLERELAEKGFASPEEVEEAFIPEDKLAEQEKALKEYEMAISNIKAHRELLEKKLAGRKLTEEQWNEISGRYEELKLFKENSIAEYENAKNRYETVKKNFANWLSLQREMKEYSRKNEHLEHIRNLLKGNAFIEYISEERLRYIAREASVTLGTLTRHRYALELDIENGFVIRDDANGGIRRLVTTLSGGETFLTSLALALALSSQIQLKGNSPLEFFFLDEGFGTLDSSLLDTVVDALERLSTKERVIGLISHVPEMKSRITRRLLVEAPVFNGAGSRVYLEKA